MDVDYERLGRNSQVEFNSINDEIFLVQEYKVGFEEALHMIYSDVAEEILINEENSW